MILSKEYNEMRAKGPNIDINVMYDFYVNNGGVADINLFASMLRQSNLMEIINYMDTIHGTTVITDKHGNEIFVKWH